MDLFVQSEVKVYSKSEHRSVPHLKKDSYTRIQLSKTAFIQSEWDSEEFIFPFLGPFHAAKGDFLA